MQESTLPKTGCHKTHIRRSGAVIGKTLLAPEADKTYLRAGVKPVWMFAGRPEKPLERGKNRACEASLGSGNAIR